MYIAFLYIILDWFSDEDLKGFMLYILPILFRFGLLALPSAIAQYLGGYEWNDLY